MERRKFIAVAGAVAAVASGADLFAQTQGKPMDMHPPKYKALEESTAKCVATGEDCLRHCLGMMSMNDTSMAACANSVVQLIAACRALQTLASVNQPSRLTSQRPLALSATHAGKNAKSSITKRPNARPGGACKQCAQDCHKLA